MEQSKFPGEQKFSRTQLRLGMLSRAPRSEGVSGDELNYLLGSPIAPERGGASSKKDDRRGADRSKK
jgi:hypothetical protein